MVHTRSQTQAQLERSGESSESDNEPIYSTPFGGNRPQDESHITKSQAQPNSIIADQVSSVVDKLTHALAKLTTQVDALERRDKQRERGNAMRASPPELSIEAIPPKNSPKKKV